MAAHTGGHAPTGQHLPRITTCSRRLALVGSGLSDSPRSSGCRCLDSRSTLHVLCRATSVEHVQRALSFPRARQAGLVSASLSSPPPPIHPHISLQGSRLGGECPGCDAWKGGSPSKLAHGANVPCNTCTGSCPLGAANGGGGGVGCHGRVPGPAWRRV